MTLADEIHDILRDLVRERRFPQVALQPATDSEPTGVAGQQSADVDGAPVRRIELGDGAALVIRLAAEAGPEDEAALQRAVRAVREARRRHGGPAWPELLVPGPARRSRLALLARVEELLAALVQAARAHGAVIQRHAQTVASAGDVDEASRERLVFLRKRLDAEAQRSRGRTSHAEIVQGDLYARSFYFDAYLFLFFAAGPEPGPGFALDFVRHHVRAVTAKLGALFPHLDDEPPTSAQVHWLPPRP